MIAKQDHTRCRVHSCSFVSCNKSRSNEDYWNETDASQFSWPTAE